MAKYSKEQSVVIALWVLARRKEDNPLPPIPNGTAPDTIVNLVNLLGEEHSSDSILLHTHGYEMCLLNRDINKTVTNLQKEICGELIANEIADKRLTSITEEL